LIDCAIASLAELGFQRTTVAEVGRRARVSKGVVTYHFPARDDLIRAVATTIFESVATHVGSRLQQAEPGAFVEAYIWAWVDYYRSHRDLMVAIAEIWTGFRDPAGRPYYGSETIEPELAGVQHALAAGQADHRLGPFSTRVMAVSLKGALDALLGQLIADPELDLDAYGRGLVELFTRAASPIPPARAGAPLPDEGARHDDDRA
jgi:TetR/AcrR family transcriptional regulator, fatty acid metabolism regulator protein